MAESSGPVVKIDYRALPIQVPPKLHELFFSNGRVGLDAEHLYLHLYYTFLKNSQDFRIRATDNYLRNGLSWGEDKLKRAKAFLKKHDLIEYQHARDEGKFSGTRIILKPLFYMELPRIREERTEAEEPTGGVKSTPAVTGGVVYRPAVHHTCGFRKQLSRTRIELSRTRKEFSLGTASPARPVDNFHPLTDHAQCKAAYFRAHREHPLLKVDPLWGGREGSLLRDLLATYSADLLCELIHLFFSDSVREVTNFVRDGGVGYDFRIFYTQVGKLVLHFNRHQPTPVVTCPACEHEILKQGTGCPICLLDFSNFNDPEYVRIAKERHDARRA